MIERIKAIIAYSNMTETQFAKKVGVTQSSLNRTIRGATEINFRLINAILTAFNEISAEWLMRGVGTMLQDETHEAEAQRLNNLIDVIAMQQETIRNLNEKIRQLKNQ